MFGRNTLYNHGGGHRNFFRRSHVAPAPMLPDLGNAHWTAFAAAEPALAAWMEAKAPTFDFARSLMDQVRRTGTLSEKQLAAAIKCATPRPPAEAVPVSGALKALFDAAKGAKLKHPRLHFAEFTVSTAPDNGKNPGALYVKATDEAGTYLGKVADGKFWGTRACTPTASEAIAALMSDPAAALDAYGKRTGNCACCGHPLTAEGSVTKGVGPVCAKKWGL